MKHLTNYANIDHTEPNRALPVTKAREKEKKKATPV